MIAEFKKIVGAQSYEAFMHVLKEIGPDSRTHRISVFIAAMLQFALRALPDECEEGSLAHALLTIYDEPYLSSEDSSEYDKIYDLIDQICNEAGMRNRRESSRGEAYSIADNVIDEYTAWYNMPWED